MLKWTENEQSYITFGPWNMATFSQAVYFNSRYGRLNTNITAGKQD